MTLRVECGRNGECGMSFGMSRQEVTRANPPASQRIGLIAGWGRYPIVVAEALRRSGHEVYCLGVKDHADPSWRTICDGFAWMGLARIGRAIRFFRRHGCRDATMAGKIHKVRLYQPWAWLKHLPDWHGIRTFYPHFVSRKKDRRDDTLLTAIVDTFAEDGIHFGPATDYAPELLVKLGQLTRRGPTPAQQKDIDSAGRWPRKWAGSTSAKASS